MPVGARNCKASVQLVFEAACVSCCRIGPDIMTFKTDSSPYAFAGCMDLVKFLLLLLVLVVTYVRYTYPRLSDCTIASQLLAFAPPIYSFLPQVPQGTSLMHFKLWDFDSFTLIDLQCALSVEEVPLLLGKAELRTSL